MTQIPDAPDRVVISANARALPRPAKPRIAAAALLGTGREVIIVHAGQEYQLRVTKNGKLILTK